MDDLSMNEIVGRIKSRRLFLGYSFQELAELTGMSKSTLQRYETGAIKNIPLDKLQILSDALEVSPAWIMGWSESVNENVYVFEPKKHFSKSYYFANKDSIMIAKKIVERPELKRLYVALVDLSIEELNAVEQMVKFMEKNNK